MSKFEDKFWLGEKIKNTDLIWLENQSMKNENT